MSDVQKTEDADDRHRELPTPGDWGAMTVTGLREVLARRLEQARFMGCADNQLLLDEVRSSGLPAYFFDHGEQLVYLDGELYDLAETSPDGCVTVQPLPPAILESGVGIEYGWRHWAGCSCPLCRRPATSTSEAGSEPTAVA
jgi:hypothetical protein